ncbi:MAG: hypothetical protein V4543_09685 [Bacteroidota bacterium]
MEIALAKLEKQISNRAGKLCTTRYGIRNNARNGYNGRILKSIYTDITIANYKYNVVYSTPKLNIYRDSTEQVTVLDDKKVIVISPRKNLPGYEKLEQLRDAFFGTQMLDIARLPIVRTIDSTADGKTYRLVVFKLDKKLQKGEKGNYLGFMISADTCIRAAWQLSERKHVSAERIIHIKSTDYTEPGVIPARLHVFNNDGKLRKQFKGYKIVKS